VQTPTEFVEALQAAASDHSNVLGALWRMNETSLTDSGLDPKTYAMVRIGALVALDASSMSWSIALEVADEAGVTLDELKGVLLAVAPAVGSVKTMQAVVDMARAMGMEDVELDTLGFT
jgi:alkylhydroperoxidase/carboxymuconolactone decarboxylase family protein YurZ